MTYLEKIRLFLADPIRDGFDTQVGDANSTQYKLSHSSLKTSSVVVLVNNSTVVPSNIDYGQGMIFLSSAPALNIPIQITYKYSVFRDEEITSIYDDVSQSFDATMLALIEILLIDAAKRFDYEHANSKMKPSQVFKNLKDMHDLYKEKVADANLDGVVGLASRIDTRYYSNEPRVATDISRSDD